MKIVTFKRVIDLNSKIVDVQKNREQYIITVEADDHLYEFCFESVRDLELAWNEFVKESNLVNLYDIELCLNVTSS